MAIFIYGTATNTGKGFFTHQDRRDFFLRGYRGHDGSNYIDTWVIGANEKGALWLADKSGTEKTKTEDNKLPFDEKSKESNNNIEDKKIATS